jgi:hypothetical protein
MSDLHPKPSGSPAPLHRRIYQRWFTGLPRDVRPFADLYPAGRDLRDGVFAAAGPFSGILRREAGRPFAVAPTEFTDGRSGKLAGEDRSYVSSEPERILFAAADAGVYGNHGWVYEPVSRSFVAESCETWDGPFSEHDLFGRPGFPKPERLTGVSFLLTSLGGQTFYHFFVETLPKLQLARDLLGSCDHILVSRYGEEWKLRWLKLWGLDGKVRILDELSHLHCDQLLFTHRLVRHFEANRWAVEALAGQPGLPARPPRSDPAGDVLWLDRSGAHLRKVEGEPAVAGAIGARPVRFEQLSPAESAQACARSRTIVGFHGAAFCNMVFCPPGTRVLEVFLEPYYPWYARLAQACGHRHRALVVDPSKDLAAQVSSALSQFP